MKNADISKVKTILFDIDQTLFDWRTMKYAALDAAIAEMKRYGLRIDEGEARKKIKEIYQKNGGEDVYDEVFEDFLIGYLGEVDYRLLATAKSAYERVESRKIAPYKDVEGTLRKLKDRGYELRIITDAPAVKTWERLVRTGLDSFFGYRDVITHRNTKKRKETGIPYIYALHNFDLEPSEVAMVGDSPLSDIAPANQVGMLTVLVKRGQVYPADYYNASQKADFEVKNIKELLKVFTGRKTTPQ